MRGMPYGWFPDCSVDVMRSFEIHEKRFQKLEDITNANDYEYITETKLVKKGKKK